MSFTLVYVSFPDLSTYLPAQKSSGIYFLYDIFETIQSVLLAKSLIFFFLFEASLKTGVLSETGFASLSKRFDG